VSTLRDVALRAGVSVGSASAVLNEAGTASAEMIRRVRKASEELGYQPDGVARSLKTGRTRTIGLVIPDIANPHFANLAKAIEIGADRAGYALMLSNTTDDPDKEVRLLRLMRMQRVDGLILVPCGIEPSHTEAIRKAFPAPIVMLDRVLRGLDYDSVVLDNRAASRMVMEYLIRAGHRRIGIVTGPPSISISTERLAGCREALAENGVAFDDGLVACGEFQSEPAYRATIALLHKRPRPTAIFSTSCHTTIGVMKALADQGFQCPQDISVAAIDDFEWANAFSPQLTTAAQPIDEIGSKAVERLLARLDGRASGAAEHIVLTPRLIVRNSCRVIG
jgi:LacI family transcriptional regulator